MGISIGKKPSAELMMMLPIASSKPHRTGGYIVAGQSSSLGNPLGDIWILKLKLNGDIDWQKTYGGTGSSTANCIRQTLDGGYIVAGETSSSGAGYADFWILKIDENGNI